MRNFWVLTICLCSSGCGTITLPTAAKLDDGTTLTGTATAAVSGGTFQLTQPGGSLSCSGTYNALDTSPTITIPVTCNDGRYGSAVITRARDGMSGSGYVTTSDGKRGVVAFGNNAELVISAPSSYGTLPTYSPTTSASSASYSRPRTSSYRTYYRGPRGGCYYINSNGNKTYVDRSMCN